MKNLMILAALLLCGAAQATPVQLVVDFEDTLTADEIRQIELDAGIFGALQPNSAMYSADKLVVGTFERVQAERLVAELSDDPGIENIELSQTYGIPAGEETIFDDSSNSEINSMASPNDPGYPKQRWNFDMIELEKAWKFSQGEGITVAILDTGVSDGHDIAHPRIGDLKDTCFVKGRNFVDKGMEDNPYDAQSHGSHVASTVAENTGNGVAGVGMAYKACIMAVKVLSDQGSGSTQGIYEGMIWAVDNGAQILSLSLGGGGHSAQLEKAVKYATDRNVLVIVAAGNGSRDHIEYPAAYPGALAVSSVGPSDNGGRPGSDPAKAELASYSSYGKGGTDGKAKIFISAPGGDKRKFGNSDDAGIWQSTVNPSNPKQWAFLAYQGTSMSTPTVSGAAALIGSALMKQNNGKFDAKKVKSLLAETATNKNDPYRYGVGILNVGGAVEQAANPSHVGRWIACLSALGAGIIIIKRKK